MGFLTKAVNLAFLCFFSGRTDVSKVRDLNVLGVMTQGEEKREHDVLDSRNRKTQDKRERRRSSLEAGDKNLLKWNPPPRHFYVKNLVSLLV